jgi:hypothetical protein
MNPKVGDLLAAKFGHVHVWDENLDDDLDELNRGEVMLVIAEFHPHRAKRLNPEFYRKVLTPNKKVGWVHLDNCLLVEKNT